jgi:hypothetical protein
VTGALFLLALATTAPADLAPELRAPTAERAFTLDLDAPASANESGFLLAPLASKVDAKAKVRLPRVSTFHDETRTFWYASGAGAVTSLAARVFVGIPGALMLFGTSATGVSNLAAAGIVGPTALIVTVGAIALMTIVDAAISALASTMVFNNMSRFYKGEWLSSFLGQLTGNALSGSVFWLTFGFGGLALDGLAGLQGLLVDGVISGMQVFSILGAMPAVVISFLATLALPALMGTWSMAAVAEPRDNYKIDPTWHPYGRRAQPSWTQDQRHAYTATTMVLPLPGT